MRTRELLEELLRELAPVERAIRRHRYLTAALPEESLGAFAGERYTILHSDRRNFANLATRFPEPPAADFFIGLAQGEGEALARLLALAASPGIDEGRLADHEPKPGCQAYTAFLSWLALNGSRADPSLAFLANLAAWGENCRRLAALLRGHPEISFFAEPTAGFEEQALAVADLGLAAGDLPASARRSARLLLARELLFWDRLANAL